MGSGISWNLYNMRKLVKYSLLFIIHDVSSNPRVEICLTIFFIVPANLIGVGVILISGESLV